MCINIGIVARSGSRFRIVGLYRAKSAKLATTTNSLESVQYSSLKWYVSKGEIKRICRRTATHPVTVSSSLLRWSSPQEVATTPVKLHPRSTKVIVRSMLSLWRLESSDIINNSGCCDTASVMVVRSWVLRNPRANEADIARREEPHSTMPRRAFCRTIGSSWVLDESS